MAPVDSLGTVMTTDGRTPLLISANAEDRDRRAKEVSGDVLTTRASDMRSLEELLEAHGVLFAVLERPTMASNASKANDDLILDWRDDGRRRLAHNRDIAHRDEVMDEDYVFLAALPPGKLEDVLLRARGALEDPSTTEADWLAFLVSEAEEAESALAHVPLQPDLTDRGAFDESEVLPPPLLSLSDLSVSFRRGAFGGPRSLADASTE